MIECITTGELNTNSYIISNEKKECILIDPGLGYKDAAKYIKDHYIPKAIFITHAHIDHMYHADEFEEVYLHERDIKAWHGGIMYASGTGYVSCQA